MALLGKLVSSSFSTSGNVSSESLLSAAIGNFSCHREDEVSINGGITGDPVPPFACEFSSDDSCSHVLGVADEEGSLRLLNTQKSAANSLLKELAAHSNAIFDISWKPGGEHIMTASGDTTISEWNVVTGELVATYKSHTGSVKSVHVNRDEPTMLVSGGRDGSIYVWDTRCSSRGSRFRPVNHVRMAHRWARASPPTKRKRLSITNQTDHQYAVTTVLFHGLNKVASCGAADGSVKLWDLRRTYSICRSEPPLSWHSFSPVGEPGRRFGFTSLVSDPWQSSLFASCTNNIIYQYSSSMLKSDPVSAFGGHTNSSFFVKSAVSPEGRYLLSGSTCGHAFIWQIDEPNQPPTVLSGHTKEVTAVCWSPELTKIVTCSDSNDFRIWRMRKSKSGMKDIVGAASVYVGEGHSKARQMVEQITTPPMRLSSLLSTSTGLKQYGENLQIPEWERTTDQSNTTTKTTGRTNRLPRNHALQLHNYFSGGDV